MYKMNTTFGSWLKAQAGRGDQIGDLADDLIRVIKRPGLMGFKAPLSNKYTDIKDVIPDHHHALLEAAHEEYKACRKHG